LPEPFGPRWPALTPIAHSQLTATRLVRSSVPSAMPRTEDACSLLRARNP
jgi:hypothetical protein